jgi:hypothetical protein
MVLEYNVNAINEDAYGLLEDVYVGDFLYESVVAKLATDRRPDLVPVGLFV